MYGPSDLVARSADVPAHVLDSSVVTGSCRAGSNDMSVTVDELDMMTCMNHVERKLLSNPPKELLGVFLHTPILAPFVFGVKPIRLLRCAETRDWLHECR